MTGGRALGLVVWAWAGVAAAQLENAQTAPPPEATDTSPQAHLVRGHAFMDDLEYLSAAQEFSVVTTHPDASEAEKQDARLHAGIAHRYMGNDVDARLFFMAVLKRNPQAQLPPGDHPPKLVTFFELVREEATAQAPPTLAPRPAALPPPDPAPSRREQRARARRNREGEDDGGFNPWALAASGAGGCGGLSLMACGTGLDGCIFVSGLGGGGDAHLQPADLAGPVMCALGVVGVAVALGLAPFWTSGPEEGPAEEASP